MKHRRIFILIALLAFSAIPCLAHHMTVVVDKGNAVQNVTSAQLAKIFKGEVKKWPDGKFVMIVLHKSSTGEMVTLERLVKMSAAELKTMFAAQKDSIRTVGSDSDVIDTVSSTPGAIGFVEEHSINDRVKVVRVDSKLPMESGYLPH
jgi:ABC-type phosphate transport system substrate-binding protein